MFRDPEANSQESSTEAGDDSEDVEKMTTYSVGEAINKLGLGPYQWALLFYAGLAWLSDAMEMMIISLLGPAIRCEWNLSAQQESAVSTVVFIGALIGANVFGALADTYGRRRGFFATAVFTFLFGLASSIAPSYAWLLVLRFFVGVGLGGSHVPVALFLEFVPMKSRGIMLVVLQSFWTVGTVIEAGLGWAFLSPFGWRILLAISSLPLLVLALLYPAIPESPFWLAAAGRTQAAEQVLHRVAAKNKKELPPGRLKAQPCVIGRSTEAGFLADLGVFLHNIKSIFTKELGLTTGLLMIIWSSNALIYYSQVLLTTVLQAQKEGSVCEDQKLHLSSSAMLDVFLTSIAELPGLLLAALLIDPIGRRKTMFLALAIVFVSTGLLVLSPSYTLLKLFLSRAASMGGFTTLIVYTPEVYPTRVRSFALGINNSTSRLGAILSPLVAVSLAQSGHVTAAEIIVAGLALLAAVSVCALPFETKNRGLEDEEQDVKAKENRGSDLGENGSLTGERTEQRLLRSEL